MFDISPVQIAIVLLIALLIFGPRRLPELGRGLGSGIRDFRNGLTGEDPGTTAAHAAAGPPAPRGEDSAPHAAAGEAAPVGRGDPA